MIRRTILVLLVLAVLGIGANDAWRFAQTQSHLRRVTYELTKWAAENASALSRDQAATRLAAAAQSQGVTLVGYDQDGAHVTLSTREEVTGTILVGTVYNLVSGVEFSKSSTTPFFATDRREAGVN